MIHLLDVNVLIALCDPAHVNAPDARRFYQNDLIGGEWATCPIVENGLLRIFGSGKYPGGPGSPQAARSLFVSLWNQTPRHHFWSDDVSMIDSETFRRLPASEDLTDIYLLALAVKHGGRFATFDHGIDPGLVPGGEKALYLLPAASGSA